MWFLAPRRRTPSYRRAHVVVVALALTGVGAHAASAQATAAHPHGARATALSCGECHGVEAWTPLPADASFDHDSDTGFMLLGSHGELDCARCHRDLRFDAAGSPGGPCGSCHLDVHQGKLGVECSSCHRATSFSDVPSIEIHARTFFPLSGVHLELACDVCHTDERRGAFSGKDTGCVDCHRADFRNTSEPDHAAAGYATRCVACHGTESWRTRWGIG